MLMGLASCIYILPLFLAKRHTDCYNEFNYNYNSYYHDYYCVTFSVYFCYSVLLCSVFL